MRWKINKPDAKLGDRRQRQVFAWLPTDVQEYRVWLEHYEVIEEYRELDSFDDVLDEVIKIQRWVEVERNIVVYY